MSRGQFANQHRFHPHGVLSYQGKKCVLFLFVSPKPIECLVQLEFNTLVKQADEPKFGRFHWDVYLCRRALSCKMDNRDVAWCREGIELLSDVEGESIVCVLCRECVCVCVPWGKWYRSACPLPTFGKECLDLLSEPVFSKQACLSSRLSSGSY